MRAPAQPSELPTATVLAFLKTYPPRHSKMSSRAPAHPSTKTLRDSSCFQAHRHAVCCGPRTHLDSSHPRDHRIGGAASRCLPTPHHVRIPRALNSTKADNPAPRDPHISIIVVIATARSYPRLLTSPSHDHNNRPLISTPRSPSIPTACYSSTHTPCRPLHHLLS